MSRQLDRYRRNAQISNNPLNTITAGNLQKLIAQPGPNAQQILDDGVEEAITNILNWIFQGTGVDLNTLDSELTTLQDNATASTAAFSTFLTSVLAAITGYTNWSTFITALESAWATYSTTESGLISSDIFTLQQFFDTVFGISPTTGQMSNTNVSSSLSLSSLEADFNTFLGWFGSPTGSTTTTTLWTDIVNDIINPLNALEISAINGLATALSALLGTSTFQSLLDSAANALGHSGTGHTIANLETYLGLIPPGNVTNVLGGANLGADVTSVQGQATTQNTWWGRLMTDVSIYLDLFHVTYPVGSPSDGPTTTISGVRTWYSAIADILALFGVVHSTSAPSNPASDVGTATSVAAAAATTAGTNASIAIASASAANTLAQGTIDGLNTAWSAGGTGNPVTTIPTIAAAIPTSAIVGGAGAAVAFGAVGAGNAVTGSTSSISTSWTHAIATGDLGVLVGISYTCGTGTVPTASVTYGGTAMTLLYTQLNGAAIGGNISYQAVFWLKSPASGSKTVAVSLTASANIVALYGNSMSYSGSKVVTTGNYSGGGSTGLSMTAASVTGNMVVGFFTSYVNNNNVLSSFSQTQRYNHGFTTVGMACAYGDAAGASSVVFTAASPYSTQQWAGVTVELSN